MASDTLAAGIGLFTLTGNSITFVSFGLQAETGVFTLAGRSVLLFTQFPPIAPTARSYSPGVRPQSVYTSLAGIEVRFSHGDRSVGQSLSLVFANITNEQGKLIIDHYLQVGTTFNGFTLPDQVFAGMASFAFTNEPTNEWRYAGPPQVEYTVPGYQNITVDLVGVASFLN
jgi:hypothetical protein